MAPLAPSKAPLVLCVAASATGTGMCCGTEKARENEKSNDAQ